MIGHKYTTEAVAKKRADADQMQTEYFQGVRKMEQKHHERIMKKVNEKYHADQRFNEGRASAASDLQVKNEAEAQRQRQIELKSRRELKEMYGRVKAKPLFLELAYK